MGSTSVWGRRWRVWSCGGVFGHLLERLEEIRVDGEVERLGSGLIGGIKRLPISYGVRGG